MIGRSRRRVMSVIHAALPLLLAALLSPTPSAAIPSAASFPRLAVDRHPPVEDPLALEAAPAAFAPSARSVPTPEGSGPAANGLATFAGSRVLVPQAGRALRGDAHGADSRGPTSGNALSRGAPVRALAVTGFSTPEGDRMAEDRTADVHVEYDIKITPKLVWAIVAPYFSARFMEQFKALLPVSIFLFAFQLLVLRQGVSEAVGITAGLMAVVLGLMFFIEGIRLGVMPLGENIGATLPAKAGMAMILFVAFLLGTIATFAEPAVAALTVLGGGVKYEAAPMLWDFLNNRTFMILLLAAAGVGLGRHQRHRALRANKSLKVTIIPGLAICVVLTVLAAFDKNARDLIGVAWDAGGITTGTVTAPLVLALGVGMAARAGQERHRHERLRHHHALLHLAHRARDGCRARLLLDGPHPDARAARGPGPGGRRSGRGRRRADGPRRRQLHRRLYVRAAPDGGALPGPEGRAEGAHPQPRPDRHRHRAGARRPGALQDRPGHRSQPAGRPGGQQGHAGLRAGRRPLRHSASARSSCCSSRSWSATARRSPSPRS